LLKKPILSLRAPLLGAKQSLTLLFNHSQIASLALAMTVQVFCITLLKLLWEIT
jgi:hypothetical protein